MAGDQVVLQIEPGDVRPPGLTAQGHREDVQNPASGLDRRRFEHFSQTGEQGVGLADPQRRGGSRSQTRGRFHTQEAPRSGRTGRVVREERPFPGPLGPLAGLHVDERRRPPAPQLGQLFQRERIPR